MVGLFATVRCTGTGTGTGHRRRHRHRHGHRRRDRGQRSRGPARLGGRVRHGSIERDVRRLADGRDNVFRRRRRGRRAGRHVRSRHRLSGLRWFVRQSLEGGGLRGHRARGVAALRLASDHQRLVFGSVGPDGHDRARVGRRRGGLPDRRLAPHRRGRLVLVLVIEMINGGRPGGHRRDPALDGGPGRLFRRRLGHPQLDRTGVADGLARGRIGQTVDDAARSVRIDEMSQRGKQTRVLVRRQSGAEGVRRRDRRTMIVQAALDRRQVRPVATSGARSIRGHRPRWRRTGA